MGVCASDNTNDPNDMGKKHDKSLQKTLDDEKNEFAKRHKLLLLGPGNSGKSTFFKQLCTIHGNGLPKQILHMSRHNVYDCCISQAKALIALWHDNYTKQLRKQGHIRNESNENGYNTHNLQGSKIIEYENEDDYDYDDDNKDNNSNNRNNKSHNSDRTHGPSGNTRLRKLSKTGKKRDYSNVPDDEDASDDDTTNKNKENKQNNKNSNDNSNNHIYAQNVRQTSETLDSVGVEMNNSNNNNNSNVNNGAQPVMSQSPSGVSITNNNENNENENNENNEINRNISTPSQGAQSYDSAGQSSVVGRATSVNSSGITDDEFDFTISDNETKDSIEFMEHDLVIMSSNNSQFEVNTEIARHIKIIWSHKAMKRTFQDRNNLTVVDSACYFFDNIERIARTEYEPTEQDVLLVRNASTGIQEQHFWIEGNLFYLYDVGGQRSERKKWIQCFDSVDAVLFVASLSCYDQNLYEQHDKNAMHETIRLFDEVVNSRYFRHTSMIIFFNKADLFRDRIKRKPLSVCFPDYNGEEGNYEPAIEFIRLIFAGCNKVPRRELYSHVTTATDKSNVTRVFNDVQHSVVLHALRRNGIL